MKRSRRPDVPEGLLAAASRLATGRRRLLAGLLPSLGLLVPSASASAAATEAEPRGIRHEIFRYGAAGDGRAGDAGALEALDRASGVVQVPPGWFRIERDLTLAGNVFVQGGRFLLDPGVTLTFEGTLDAPASRIFEGAGSARSGHARTVAVPQWWGARGDDLHDDSDALAAAFAFGGPVRLPEGRYRVSRTLRPGRRMTIESEDATLQFVPEGEYASVHDADGGESGFRVAFDIVGMHRATLRGALTLQMGRYISGRVEPPARPDLVALTLSAPEPRAGGLAVDSLTIRGFGRALFQAGNRVLPYTRSRFGTLILRGCGRAWEMRGHNGWDDVWVDVLYVNKCREPALLRNVDLAVGQFFLSGDREAAATTSARTRAGDPWIMLEDAREVPAPGERLALWAAGPGGSTLVARVLEHDGRRLRLAQAPAASFDRTPVFARPSGGLSLRDSNLTCAVLYLEGLFGEAVELETGSGLRADLLKVSQGIFACESNAAVRLAGPDGRCEAALSRDEGHGRRSGSGRIGTVVALAMPEGTDSTPPRRTVHLTLPRGVTYYRGQGNGLVQTEAAWPPALPCRDQVTVEAADGLFRLAEDGRRLMPLTGPG